jgi:serine/threonine-protein kinase
MVAVAKIVVPKAGQTIAGKYRLLRRIGSGGMADVFEAEHIYTRRLVAMKIMHPMLVADTPEITERVFREAAIASAIAHPGIVGVLDAGEDVTGVLYIAFELLDGEDLETALYDGRVGPRDLVIIAVKTLEALAAVHAAGIVHRDVKPANVFLARTARGRWSVKLLDFGIALEIDDGARFEQDRGTVVGTVEYMSPEQALGDPIDARTDIYAMGALLFRGLAGRMPFIASDYQKLLVMVATEDAPSIAKFRPDLPEALVAIVDQALLRDRDARFDCAEAMAYRLRTIDLDAIADLPGAPGAAWGVRERRTSSLPTRRQDEYPAPSAWR